MAARARTRAGIFETVFFVVMTLLARETELLDMFSMSGTGTCNLPR